MAHHSLFKMTDRGIIVLTEKEGFGASIARFFGRLFGTEPDRGYTRTIVSDRNTLIIHTHIPSTLSGGITDPSTEEERKTMITALRANAPAVRTSLIEQIPAIRIDLTKRVGGVAQVFENNNYLLKLDQKEITYDPTPTARTITYEGQTIDVPDHVLIPEKDEKGENNPLSEKYINPSGPGGSINCDHGLAAIVGDHEFAICTLNDGNNWGTEPRNAAVKANETAIQSLTTGLSALSKEQEITHQDIFRVHDQALSDASVELARHSNDTDGEKRTGTTCPLLMTVAGDFAHLTSIGDTKAFIIKQDLSSLREPSEGNRGGFDAKDPGGRIGKGEDDFRNYSHSLAHLNPGDVVILCSDGIHDNLDPHTLGLTPREVDRSLDAEDWDDKNPSHIAARTQFMHNKLLEVLKEFKTNNDIQERPLTSEEINTALDEYVQKVNLKTKLYLIQNPTKKIPENYKEYPGKPDHNGIIVYQH